MILYNITFNVAPDIEQDFISWMQEIHIPEVMGTGKFYEHKFLRLLHDTDDGSSNLCVQYFAERIEDMMDYEKEHAATLRAKTQAKFGEKAIAFRTLLESI